MQLKKDSLINRVQVHESVVSLGSILSNAKIYITESVVI